jgi:hypothetical protein
MLHSTPRGWAFTNIDFSPHREQTQQVKVLKRLGLGRGRKRDVSENVDVTVTGFAQADKDEEGDHPQNMLDAMRRAVNEGGYKGLYKGMNVSLQG